MVELALMKSRRRPDPNNPSKEDVDAQQEQEKATWEERWKNDQKMKEVFTSSKLVSKAKMKMKVAMSGTEDQKSAGKDEAKTEERAESNTVKSTKEISKAAKAPEPQTEEAKPKEDVPTVTELPG